MLQKVISQLSKAQYEQLHEELAANRGEKFSKLLELYRENLEDAEIRETIDAKQAAFYTLKSRLFDKVQQYLFRTSSDNRAELLKNVSSIPYLIYNTPRETAISLLLHLESALKKEDMPAELVSVYSGLKKLHLHTSEFYHYQQLYNKNVAYMLALDKAEEVVSLFTRELGDYLLSLSEEKTVLLKLYLRELNNLSRLYDSHRLKINHIIVGVTYAIFVDEKNEIPDSEETIEELLLKFKTILESYPDHRNYRFLEPVRLFLNFEYYHQLSLHKNNKAVYEKLNNSLETFLILSHSCPTTRFLLSKLEHEIYVGGINNVTSAENLVFLPDQNDAFSCVNFYMYGAACFFHSNKFSEAASTLNHLLNEISFKDFPFAEAGVKLFLTLNLLLAQKSDQAEIILRSISRKLSSEELSGHFPAADAFAKLLKIALNDNSSTKLKKLETAFHTFIQLNKGKSSILNIAPLQPVHLQKLAE
ncbi:MAG: hypothetical protein M3R17_20910 [Bacteroidota bacterium]|nr:hypothetical protein [Bacteroidota bacterium]